MLSEAGIKFDKHAVKGIDPQLFSEYLIASGKERTFSFIFKFITYFIIFVTKNFFAYD